MYVETAEQCVKSVQFKVNYLTIKTPERSVKTKAAKQAPKENFVHDNFKSTETFKSEIFIEQMFVQMNNVTNEIIKHHKKT